MAESPSNPTTLDTAENGHAEGMANGVAATLRIAVGEDGVPVVDLREAPARDGALAVIDGELVLVLADGTEWPVDQFYGDAAVLQLGELAFVAAEAVKSAIGGDAGPVPVAGLATVAAAGEAATPQGALDEAAAEDAQPVSGGAAFRAFAIDPLGVTLDPVLALGPTSLGQGDGAAGLDLFPDLASVPGNGGVFVNLAPVANDDRAVTSERQAVEIDVLANDRDPNPGDKLRILEVDTTGLKGEVTITPDGKVSYDPNGQFKHLGKGETATETFTYTVADQHGATSTATVKVTIQGVNDAPVAKNDHAATSEKAPVLVNVLANDRDPDANDALEVVAVDTTGLQGNLHFYGNGQFVYDPAGQFTHLGKGQTATETFQYMVSDPHGATDIATVEIVIHGVNDAPVANDDVVYVSEKGEVRFDALANDFDPDHGDTIRVLNLFSLGGSKGQRWIDHEGTISYRPYGAYDYLGAGEYAIQQFGYTITDQHGATDTAVVTVIVVGVNDAPVANDDKAVTNEKTGVVINVLANDYDVDINDTIQVVAVDVAGLQGSLTYLGDGTFGYDPNGAFDHLGVGQSATETFRYMVSDQHGATDIATVEIVIHGVNDAPVAVDDHFTGFQTIGFYAPIAALLANDYDVDNGDTIHFAGVGNAVNGEVWLTDDGYVVFTPTAGYVGAASFEYAIQDQHGAYDIGQVNVDVRPITPGDMSYQTLSWFAATSDATVQQLENGVTLIDLAIEVGVVAAAGLEIGGMPFFASSLSGVLQGVISVAILPDGTPLVTGNLAGDLDLQVETSPIFAALGGDVYDALYLASGASGDPYALIGGAAPTPDLDFANALFDLVEQVVQGIDLGGIEALLSGQGLGDSSAIAFGNGVFYLDIAGLISGAITVPGGHGGAPLIDADIVGQFAAAAIFDIRDDLTVVSDGYIGGDFNAAVAPAGIGAGFAIGSVVSEEQAIAA